MRLVCPNCDAQYEVADGAIADAGRDVQCSNCGHTWFQLPPDIEAELEAEDALFGKTPSAQAPAAIGATKAPTRAIPAAKSAAWDDDFDDEEPQIAAQTAGKTPPPAGQAPAGQAPAGQAPVNPGPTTEAPVRQELAAPPPISAPPLSPPPPLGAPAVQKSADVAATQMPQPAAARRSLDESLMAVLREEAERETSVRRSETPRPLEQQTELGLEETSGAASAAKAVRDRLARLRGQEAEPEANDKPTARRDLLPDIEEINSTLRASTENRSGDEATMAQQSQTAKPANTGFRSGFSLMLLVAVLLIVAYLAAPKIAEQFPASRPALDSYVAGVDSARVWLDRAMRNAISGLQNLTGGVN